MQGLALGKVAALDLKDVPRRQQQPAKRARESICTPPARAVIRRFNEQDSGQISLVGRPGQPERSNVLLLRCREDESNQ